MTYRCPKHELDGLTSPCPSCIAEFEHRKPAADMTVAERVATLRSIPDILTIPFNSLHQWVEELMGRPVWTHEFAKPEELISELESGMPSDIGDVMGKLPWDKPLLLVDLDAGTVEEV